MKKKIFVFLIMTAMILSLAACSKQEDTGIIVSVGDENKDSGLNDMTTETNDKDNESVSTEDNKEDTDKKADEYMDYITSGFVTENGDIYQFNVDGTYSCYLVETGTSSYGTYETDGKSYMTLKCTEDNSGEDESITEENNVVAYTTEEPQGDGTVLVTEYGETDNIINQYTREENLEEAPITEEEAAAAEKEEEAASNGEVTDTVLYEITYKLTRTTTTDEYDNSIEVVILSKGETKIVLQKQFELQ